MASDLSRWMGALSDLEQAHKESLHPPIFKKLFAGSTVEQEAANVWAAKRKATAQRDELRQWVQLTLGQKAWNDLVAEEGRIRKRRQETLYRQRERRRKFVEIVAWTIMIGAGVAGCEVALAMHHALARDGAVPKVALVEATGSLSGFAPRAEARMRAALAEAGVDLRLSSSVARIEADRVLPAAGEALPSRFTVGATGAVAHGWLSETGLPVTDDGFVLTGADCRVSGQADLFAVGDCAHFSPRPLVKAGVYAVRVAPVL